MQRIDASPYFRFAGIFWAVLTLYFFASLATAQELVLTPANLSGGTGFARPPVVFPDLGAALANPPKTYIVSLDNPLPDTHGLALIAANRALMSQLEPGFNEGGSVSLVDTAAAVRIDNYALPPALPLTTPPTLYDGYGTLSINPARTHILAITRFKTLWVIHAPFDHTAAVTVLALPSSACTEQTRAIAFDSTSGRAYIAVLTGIVAVDPPYTSIAFTIPTINGPAAGGNCGAVALSPDNSTLVATNASSTVFGFDPQLRIFHAPFSTASVPEVLTISGSNLDGMTFTPDGSKIMVVDFLTRPLAPARVYVVAAPFSASSTVETLQFVTGPANIGFEDVDISADGQLAALSGGDASGDPLVVLKAPFTVGGFNTVIIPIPGFNPPYAATAGRGAGTARFWSSAIPALPPQMFVDNSAGGLGPLMVTEGNSGTKQVLIPVHLSGPSAVAVTFSYTTVDGTATVADNDYVPASGTLSFAPGETTKNIVVEVVGDTKYEADELFKVVISNPVNATLLGPTPGFADTGTIQIVNDDASVPVAITSGPPPNGVAGTPYSFQLTGTGAQPLTWSLSGSSLPFGLTLNTVTGLVSGIPLSPQTVSVVITVFDANHVNVSAFYAITITGVGQPFLEAFPSTRDFGTSAVGSTSAIMSVGVDNEGFAAVLLGNPFVTIPPGSDFALATGDFPCTDGQTLAQGNGCPLYFTFTPKAAGPRSLVLNLPSNSVIPATLTLTGVGTGGGVLPVSAVSRKVHGAAGTFDIPLSLVSTNPTTEPRQGPTHTIVIPFASAVTAATATITEGIATAGTPTFSGNAVIVPLSGVADQQYVTLTLSNVATAAGAGSGTVRIGFLRGDVNQNRVVTVADEGLVNAQLAQFVTQSNFIKDVNVSGTLSVADRAITQANLTRNLPAP
jgi:Calx-beta domain/Putative Ig domain